MNFSVVVSVSDKHLWCLKPFSLLFNKYWSSDQRVVVAGYTPPDFDLPVNFQFYSIAVPQYPKERWANGLIELFENLQVSYAVILLEDYWICRRVDTQAIYSLAEYMSKHPEILRIDLTADRLYAGGMRDVDYWQRFDMIEAAGSQYQMSLQAGLWNVPMLYNLLTKLPNDKRSAWDVELTGTTMINNFGDKMRVVGTRQWPIRYANGLNNAAGKKIFYDNLSLEDANMVEYFVPEEYR